MGNWPAKTGQRGEATLNMLPTDPEAIISLLSNRTTPSETLAAIRAAYRDRFDSPDIQAALAAHRTSKQALLRHLAASSSKAVRLALARNPNTPADIMGELAVDSHQPVRVAVAKSKSTPVSVLMDMAQAEPTAQVAKVLAGNSALRSTTEGQALAERLAEDGNARKRPRPASVKVRVDELFASNPTRKQLDALKSDKSASVRWAAVIRGYELGAFPPEAAVNLIRETPQARQVLEARWHETKNLRIADVMIEAGSDHILATAIRNDEITDPVRIEAIVHARLPASCWAIATTMKLTPELLRYLSLVPSFSWEVWDPLPAEDLRVGMVFTPIPNTSFPLGHVACHTQVIVALHPLTPRDVLDRLVKARSRYVRAALAERPFENGLERLAADKEPEVRAAVARSSGLTPAIRTLLEGDADPLVRAALLENPASRS
jgi:hypothetical protein